MKRHYSYLDRSVPASVRSYNLGAIGATQAGHENKFGKIAYISLPGSNGKPLLTPVFMTPGEGAAYWGHWLYRRALKDGRRTSIRAIPAAYSTGHAEAYQRAVVKDSGISADTALDIWQDQLSLWRIMMAMAAWEAGARSINAPNYKYFQAVYGDQEVIDLTYQGLLYGLALGAQEAGLEVALPPYPGPPLFTPLSETVDLQVDHEGADKSLPGQRIDPFVYGPLSGGRSAISFVFTAVSSVFQRSFEVLGMPNAAEFAELATYLFGFLLGLFLVIKFWKLIAPLLEARAVQARRSLSLQPHEAYHGS